MLVVYEDQVCQTRDTLTADVLVLRLQVDEHLQHWPKFLVHKNKQRLTKITQYLIRMRKLALRATPKLTTITRR